MIAGWIQSWMRRRQPMATDPDLPPLTDPARAAEQDRALADARSRLARLQQILAEDDVVTRHPSTEVRHVSGA